MIRIAFRLLILACSSLTFADDLPRTLVRGRIVDSASKRDLPARLYVVGEDGTSFFARTTQTAGLAIPYDKKRGGSIERHTTLSAHPFELRLAPGKYRFTAVRGKEYLEATREVEVAGESLEVVLELRHWIDMAERGWFSGETHVHRTLAELPNLLLAEDLNVAFPLTQWETHAYRAPRTPKVDPTSSVPDEAKWHFVDSTHAIYPRNTEYEIFTVDGKSHHLGAFFVIRHKEPFDGGVPPVSAIAREAKRQGALLELDKHNWPWSMAIVPTMGIDLFELTNNHIWRTDFLFKGWGEQPAEYMEVTSRTEDGWIEFGFQNYYALLNCGFRLRPTAGTASGVHPVPLGFGRVYVQMDPTKPFDPDEWTRRLDEGRSFVTTGPMLFANVDGHAPGATIKIDPDKNETAEMRYLVRCESPLEIRRIETIVNGEVIPFPPDEIESARGSKSSQAPFVLNLRAPVRVKRSQWIASRAWYRLPNGRWRFAHSSPTFIDVEGKPLRPKRREVEYLMGRVRDQIERSERHLPKAAIAEYRRALLAYERLLESAK